MKRLYDSVVESLLDDEDALINKEITITDGLYCMYNDGNIVKVMDHESGEVFTHDHNNIEALGVVLGDHKYWFKPHQMMREFEASHNKRLCDINIKNVVYDAINDFDGEQHTKELNDASKFIPVVLSTQTKTKHINDWYLPSLGEMSIINEYSYDVNSFLEHKFFNTGDGVYWTSSIVSEYDVWVCMMPKMTFTQGVHVMSVRNHAEGWVLPIAKWKD